MADRHGAAILFLTFLFVMSVAYAGYRSPPHPMRQLTNHVEVALGRRLLKAAAPLPTKYDLRDEDGKGTSYLSPIKDQLSYGTCWAHAAMVGIEYLLRKNEGIDADLSENNLANMHGFASSFEDGGTHEMAMAVFLREDGPTTEVLDPYPSIGTSMRERGVRIPRKIVLVSARSSVSSAAQLQADNEVIKRALVQYGPLSTSYYHGSSYLKGAAYYCKYRYGSNHAVSIVGWDDDYAASNFKTTPPGKGAFIIKNSWGAYMFDEGYTYISYYDANLGFEPQVAYMRLSKGEDYGRIYEHDPFGYVSSTGYGSTTAHAMNVFTARRDEQLAAFGFYALKPSTTYSAKIVLNPVMARGELVGTEYAVASGTATDAGYEVLDFAQTVSVGAGTNFAIVVAMTTPNYTLPVAVMHNEVYSDGSPYVSGVKAVPGKSYLCPDPTRYVWSDISTEGEYFCCKVYTKALATDKTTCGDTPVAYSWLDAYSANHGIGDYLASSFYGSYNALSEHVATNRRTIAASYAQGLDPDNATETNLTATISFDSSGKPVIGISPKNDALWSYTTLGSTDLHTWHPKSEGDRFFKVMVEAK